MQLGVVPRNLLVLIGLALAPFFMGAAQRPSNERPIPQVERFVHGQGLRIRLTVRNATVAAFENPGFEVVFENVGRNPIKLNPHVASNVYIYGADGKLVPAYRGWIAELVGLVLKRADLVVLQPGQRLSR